MVFDSFFTGGSQNFQWCSKTIDLKDGLLSSKITIPTLGDISVPTNWNNYKFFSISQNVMEINVMVYNKRKNPKIFKKILVATVLENYIYIE